MCCPCFFDVRRCCWSVCCGCAYPAQDRLYFCEVFFCFQRLNSSYQSAVKPDDARLTRCVLCVCLFGTLCGVFFYSSCCSEPFFFAALTAPRLLCRLHVLGEVHCSEKTLVTTQRTPLYVCVCSVFSCGFVSFRSSCETFARCVCQLCECHEVVLRIGVFRSVHRSTFGCFASLIGMLCTLGLSSWEGAF